MGETILDNSQTTNIVQNIIPISTRGQMLPGETNSIRPVA
jgi:hypothetical protein